MTIRIRPGFRCTAAFGIVALLTFVSPAAQTPSDGAHVEFEVASVKLVEPPAPAHAVGLNITPGRLLIEAATLRQILGLAYAIQRVRVIGGPSWTDAEQYSIAAKTESADVTPQQVRTMLQALMADRFKVSVRRASREISMYRLVRIKDAPALQLAKDGEKAEVIVDKGRLAFANSPVSGLVNYLANILNSPVQDETGLSGLYDFSLETVTAAGEMVAPFTAVQEQLGLKLQPTKARMEVLIIDHAERPTPN
jgi:uncharacterized protein (TIGR03435 family)